MPRAETGDVDDIAAGLIQELRRGTLVAAALARLATPHYGYELVEQLTELGLGTDGNTLYPLLRRLEGQGLLASEWDTTEARPRKFYSTTPLGERVLAQLTDEWSRLNEAMTAVFAAPKDH